MVQVLLPFYLLTAIEFKSGGYVTLLRYICITIGNDGAERHEIIVSSMLVDLRLRFHVSRLVNTNS